MDFERLDLRHLDFESLDFQEYFNGQLFFHKKIFDGVVLKCLSERYQCPILFDTCRFEGNFSRMAISQYSFYACTFDKALMEATIFEDTQFEKCTWWKTDLSRVQFVWCEQFENTFIECNQTNVKSQNVTYSQCKIILNQYRYSIHTDCDFKFSEFISTDISNANFINCDMRAVQYIYQEIDEYGHDDRKSNDNYTLILLSLLL